MKIRGKTVRQFYPDGNPESLVLADLSNWSGGCYKIPRPLVKEIKDTRPELSNPGVYFLLGADEETKYVYIGEAENVHSRLQSHLSKKDFWSEVIVFISNNDNGLNKAFVKYLESRLYEEAKNCSRYYIKNENKPTKSSLREYDKVEMEEFLDHIKFLTRTLGHNLFIPAASQSTSEEKEKINPDELFYISTSTGAEAKSIYMEGHKMKVLEGSLCAPVRKSCPSNIVSLIETLTNSGVLIDNKFVKDCEFTSPSSAAAVIIGGHASGNNEWKSSEGFKLGTIIGAHKKYKTSL